MKVKYTFILLSLLFSTVITAQWQEVHRISWSDYADGIRLGNTASGAIWFADNDNDGNKDGTGFFGPRAGVFVWEDWEGRTACPCVPMGPNNCGANDNNFAANFNIVGQYCRVRVSFTVRAVGMLECGNSGPDGGYSPGICPTTLGADWAGADFMQINIVDADGGNFTRNICGSINTGVVTTEFPVIDGFSTVSLNIVAGTQEVDERYEITDVIVEALRTNIPLNLNANLISGSNNAQCLNSGRPLTFSSVVTNPAFTYLWTGPNGFTSNQARPQINSYTSSAQGTYNVSVTDANGCTISDQVTISLLLDSDDLCSLTPVFVYDQSPANSILCSNQILPDTSLNGIRGTWSPGNVLALYAGQTRTFTFTPINPAIAPYNVVLQIDDVGRLSRIGVQPTSTPTFCNADPTSVNLISLYQLDTSLLLRVNGANQLFDFVPSNEFLNNYISQFSSFSFLGIPAGMYTFFVEGVSECGEANTADFSFLIIAAGNPTRIDTTVCSGNLPFLFGGFEFYGDSTILGSSGGACDTILTLRLRTTGPRTAPGFPLGTQSPNCRARQWAYLYDSLNAQGTRGLIALDQANNPVNPNYVAVFTDDYIGPYVLPWTSASNGCDSIVTLRISFQGGGLTTRDIIDLCSNRDTTVLFGGNPFRLSAATPIIYVTNQIGQGSCDLHIIEANLIQVIEDTIIHGPLCADETFTLGGEVFSISRPSGRIFGTLGANGCESSTYVEVEFINTRVEEQSARLCPGQAYTVGSNVFRNESFTDSIIVLRRQASTGCDSLVRLTLDVLFPRTINFDTTICRNASIDFLGVTYDINNPSGFSRLASPSLGCDSIVYQVNVSFFQEAFTVNPPPICEGDSYSFGNQILTTSDTYTESFTSLVTGCDSVVTLNLVVIPTSQSPVTVEFCSGSSYTIGSQTFNAPGDYDVNLTSEVTGCDSIVNLTLVERAILTTDITEVLCIGESYLFGGLERTTADVYVENLTSASTGCDSVVTLNLSFYDEIDTSFVDQTCAGLAYIFGNQTLFQSGTYREVFRSTVTGCDSIVNLALTVSPPVSDTVRTQICQGEIIVHGNQSITIGGVFPANFVTLAGCDSIAVLEVELLDTFYLSILDTIIRGQSRFIDGVQVTEPGIYTESLFSQGGCDSTVVIDLFVIEEIRADVDLMICAGDSVEVGGRFYSTNTMTTVIIPSSIGADSVITLTVNVVDTIVNDFGRVVVCDVDLPYMWGGENLFQADQYERAFISALGCDSIVRLNLVVEALIIEDESIDLCRGEVFTYGGVTYTIGNDTTVSGRFISQRTGCDSIVTLNINVLDTFYVPISSTITRGQSFNFDGVERTTADIYSATLTSESGCDSTVILDLSVIDEVFLTIDTTVCPGVNFRIFNNSYAADTMQILRRLGAGGGPDTIVDLTIRFLRPDDLRFSFTEVLCHSETFDFNGAELFATGIYRDTLLSFFGCDSIVTLNLTVLPNPSIGEQDRTLCTGGSLFINGSFVNTPGLYSEILQSVAGCDSLVIVNLSVSDAFVINLNPTICDGQSYSVGTSTYSSSGMYTDTLTASIGCDSIVNVNLTVAPLFTLNINEVICAGEEFIVGGIVYNQTIVSSITLQSLSGCDSTINLSLEVLPEINTVVLETICEGESVMIGGMTFNMSGTYDIPHTAITGCDSTVRLNLIVLSGSGVEVSRMICTGDTLTVGNDRFTTSGMYTITLQSFQGCDSVVTVTLAVLDILRDSVSATVCEGESFSFRGRTLSVAGNYSDTLVSSIGCDSIITLVLNVTPDFVIGITNVFGTCEGQANGGFTISSSVGVTLPLMIDGLPGGTRTVSNFPFQVSSLAQGTYNLVATDANGCMSTGRVEITEDRDGLVSIVAIPDGDQGDYNLFVNFNGIVRSISWDNVPGLSCYDCPNPRIRIIDYTTVGLTLVDDIGCTYRASVDLDIPNVGNVYIPNAFRPDGPNGENSVFFLQAEDGLLGIYDLKIYDRWGNMVFEVDGALLGDRSRGWTGRFNDLPAPSGVYVYYARVINSQGIEGVFKGDVTVIR